MKPGRPALRRRRDHRPFATAAVVVAAILLLASGYFWLIGAGRGLPPQAQIGGPFELVQGDGQTVTDRSFRGKYLLIYFGYTSCQDVCPVTLTSMTAALEILGPQGRPNPAAVHHGRSRARHPAGHAALRQRVHATVDRPDRLARSGPQGRGCIPARRRRAPRWPRPLALRGRPQLGCLSGWSGWTLHCADQGRPSRSGHGSGDWAACSERLRTRYAGRQLLSRSTIADRPVPNF